MKLLLNNGADTDIMDVYRQTPVCTAAVKGQTEAVRLLVNNGANLDIKNRWGWAALGLAGSRKHKEIVDLLLSGGAKVTGNKKMYGTTAFHKSVWTKNNTEVLAVFLKHGVDIEIKDKYKRTPLYSAAAHNKIKNLKFLLKIGLRIFPIKLSRLLLLISATYQGCRMLSALLNPIWFTMLLPTNMFP